MIILAFDTCFGACSAAVYGANANNTLAQRFEVMDKGHSERLIPMLAEVLAEAGCALRDVSTLAVTVGPGSFTGVRTGLAVARSLVLAHACEIRGTTSLHVMAAGVRAMRAEGPIAIAVATRDDLVYFAAFEGTELAQTVAPCLATPRDAARRIATSPHTIAGSGATLVAAVHSAGDCAHRVITEPVFARADLLAGMTVRLPVLAPPRPLYLREADAKPAAAGTLSFAPAP